MVSADPLAVGSVVRGTYTVEAPLGSGAFGTVYRVRHRFLGIQAMKVYPPSESEWAVQAFLDEVRVLAELTHDKIVRLYDANTLDGTNQPYVVMEYAPLGTVEDCLDQRIRLHPLSAMKVAAQVCEGLAVAHGRVPAIVHRDITTRNVLVFGMSVHGTPQVKVADFGLACRVGIDSGIANAVGSIAFLPPEADWGYHTPASDVYSVGVVLFRCLTGTYPFPERLHSRGAGRRQAGDLTKPPPLPSQFVLGLPTQIDSLVRRALAPVPRDRFATASEFGAQLQLVIGEFLIT